MFVQNNEAPWQKNGMIVEKFASDYPKDYKKSLKLRKTMGVIELRHRKNDQNGPIATFYLKIFREKPFVH